MKKIALFGSDFPSLSERAELDPFWVLDVKRLQNAFFFNSFPLSSAGACLLAPFWSLPFCFFLLFLACFPPSGLRACWLARFWLSLACAVLSGSFLAVCGSYLLGWASLVVTCLRCLAVACLLCPVWLVSVAVCGSYLLGWASLLLLPACVVLSGSFLAVSGLYLLGWVSLAAADLLWPVRLVSGRLWFLPAWLGVSGCYFALPCPVWLLFRRLWFTPAWLRFSGRLPFDGCTFLVFLVSATLLLFPQADQWPHQCMSLHFCTAGKKNAC